MLIKISHAFKETLLASFQVFQSKFQFQFQFQFQVQVQVQVQVQDQDILLLSSQFSVRSPLIALSYHYHLILMCKIV